MWSVTYQQNCLSLTLLWIPTRAQIDELTVNWVARSRKSCLTRAATMNQSSAWTAFLPTFRDRNLRPTAVQARVKQMTCEAITSGALSSVCWDSVLDSYNKSQIASDFVLQLILELGMRGHLSKESWSSQTITGWLLPTPLYNATMEMLRDVEEWDNQVLLYIKTTIETVERYASRERHWRSKWDPSYESADYAWRPRGQRPGNAPPPKLCAFGSCRLLHYPTTFLFSFVGWWWWWWWWW